ncbi:YIP1 family protein [Geofilum rhodophaeum]|uniref:YIP1 family protein n=1 Tax=Geofilum rhodophaeum TaxID=1965019 RepID=UPI000B528D15|nr:YIP1 family protein [Geofilum rhodophaeum]
MSNQKTISTAQLYRNLMLRAKNLVLQPRSEWATVRSERKNLNEVLSEFSLPLISLVTLATFLNILVNHQGFNFELALKHAALIFTSLFGGLYLAWLLLKTVRSATGVLGDKNQIFELAAYASGFWYLILLLTALVPELTMLNFLALYSFYILWTYMEEIPGISREHKGLLTLLVGFSIHFLPLLVRQILFNLIHF